MKLTAITLCLVLILTSAAKMAAYEIVPIELINGDSAMSLSSDGLVVVGTHFTDTATPVRWTRDGGAEKLGTFLENEAAGAVDVSGDGSVVVGLATTLPNAGFRWTADAGFVALGSLPASDLGSRPRAVSDDGRTVVGSDHFGYTAFRWTEQDGMVALGVPTGATNSNAFDVSADGSVVAVVGETRNSSDVLVNGRATLWTAQAGYQHLGPLPAGWDSTYPVALSGDGHALVGLGGPGLEGDTRGRPFKWSLDEGIQPLPTLQGGQYLRLSMTPDGTVVLGNERTGDGDIPVVWTKQHGARRLHDVLAQDHGFSASDLLFDFTRAISADQKTLVVRTGTTRANYQLWALYLDKPLVTPVPEPATWAMSLGLITMATLCMRRQFRVNS